MLTVVEPSGAIRKARGIVARTIEPTSPVVAVDVQRVEVGGKSVSASRRLPPCRRLATSCGLMSLVVPTSASAAGRRRLLVAARATGEGQRSDQASPQRSVGSSCAPTLTAIGVGLRHCGKQSPGVFVLRIGEHLVAVALIDDRALEHHRDAMREVLTTDRSWETNR